MIRIIRKEHFNAAHKLFNPDWSQEKNEEVYGPCANENWHGHNFELIVTVRGNPDPETGFVMDLNRLSGMINEHIIDKVDHRNLNLDVDFLKGKFTSCETLVVEFWKILEPLVRAGAHDASLYSLKLIETRKNSVEYFGE